MKSMQKSINKLKNRQGFTLIEILIVVSIIAVLVSVAVPTMSKHLETSRETVDAANIRSQYSVVMADAVLTDGPVNVGGCQYPKIKLTQTTSGWQTLSLKKQMQSYLPVSNSGDVPAQGYAWIEYNAEESRPCLYFEDADGVVVSASINWAGQTDLMQQGLSLLSPGVDTKLIYGNNTSNMNESELAFYKELKKQLNISDEATIHYGYNPWPTFKVTILETPLEETDFNKSGTYAKSEWATRVSYDTKTHEIVKVEKTYGGWGNNGGVVGFWGNTHNGKYPTEVLYEKAIEQK